MTARSWQITSFVLGADRVGGGMGGGGWGERGGNWKWVRMLVVPFRGQNQ